MSYWLRYLKKNIMNLKNKKWIIVSKIILMLFTMQTKTMYTSAYLIRMSSFFVHSAKVITVAYITACIIDIHMNTFNLLNSFS